MLITFLQGMILPGPVFSAQILTPSSTSFTGLLLPEPGSVVPVSSSFQPPTIQGITIYPKDPLRFDFIIHHGDDRIQGAEFENESNKLIRYFLASLTVPEEDLWVNLSPYESERIIPNEFGYTEMGRDLLAEDYILKQLTASLMHPDEETGEEYWDHIFEKVEEAYGTSDINLNTFNKVWVVPDEAIVYESGESAYVVKSHLKVMLEKDYLALKEEKLIRDQNIQNKDDDEVTDSTIQSEAIRNILIPYIEKEINEGKNFWKLRQIYHSMILATWFKQKFKQSLLGQIYVDQNKILGVDLEDKDYKQKIYEQYISAFKIGVFDYLREDYDPATQQIIPRKYFSGGMVIHPQISVMSQENLGVFDVEYRNELANFLNRHQADAEAAMLSEVQGYFGEAGRADERQVSKFRRSSRSKTPGPVEAGGNIGASSEAEADRNPFDAAMLSNDNARAFEAYLLKDAPLDVLFRDGQLDINRLERALNDIIQNTMKNYGFSRSDARTKIIGDSRFLMRGDLEDIDVLISIEDEDIEELLKSEEGEMIKSVLNQLHVFVSEAACDGCSVNIVGENQGELRVQSSPKKAQTYNLNFHLMNRSAGRKMILNNILSKMEKGSEEEQARAYLAAEYNFGDVDQYFSMREMYFDRGATNFLANSKRTLRQEELTAWIHENPVLASRMIRAKLNMSARPFVGQIDVSSRSMNKNFLKEVRSLIDGVEGGFKGKETLSQFIGQLINNNRIRYADHLPDEVWSRRNPETGEFEILLDGSLRWMVEDIQKSGETAKAAYLPFLTAKIINKAAEILMSSDPNVHWERESSDPSRVNTASVAYLLELRFLSLIPNFSKTFAEVFREGAPLAGFYQSSFGERGATENLLILDEVPSFLPPFLQGVGYDSTDFNAELIAQLDNMIDEMGKVDLKQMDREGWETKTEASTRAGNGFGRMLRSLNQAEIAFADALERQLTGRAENVTDVQIANIVETLLRLKSDSLKLLKEGDSPVLSEQNAEALEALDIDSFDVEDFAEQFNVQVIQTRISYGENADTFLNINFRTHLLPHTFIAQLERKYGQSVSWFEMMTALGHPDVEAWVKRSREVVDRKGSLNEEKNLRRYVPSQQPLLSASERRNLIQELKEMEFVLRQTIWQNEDDTVVALEAQQPVTGGKELLPLVNSLGNARQRLVDEETGNLKFLRDIRTGNIYQYVNESETSLSVELKYSEDKAHGSTFKPIKKGQTMEFELVTQDDNNPIHAEIREVIRLRQSLEALDRGKFEDLNAVGNILGTSVMTPGKMPDTSTIDFADQRMPYSRTANEPPKGDRSHEVAVALALDPTELLLVEGGPGAAKSTVNVEIIHQLVKQGKSVGFFSHNHHAVDTVVSRMMNKDMPVLRLGKRPDKFVEKFGTVAVWPGRGYERTDEQGAIDDEPAIKERVVRQFRARQKQSGGGSIIASTNAAIDTDKSLEKILPKVASEGFDVIIIDEGSLENLPGALVVMQALKKGGKLIVTGDGNQLAKMVYSGSQRKRIKKMNYFQGLSSTERDAILDRLEMSLIDWIQRRKRGERVLLSTIYRSHPLIAGLTSEVFYNGDLNVRGAEDFDEDTFKIINIDRGIEGEPGYDKGRNKSRYNEVSARASIRRVRHYLKSYQDKGKPIKASDISIITMYSEQVRVLKEMVDREFTGDKPVIATVDSMQGDENKVVIVDMVRSNLKGEPGFTLNKRRLNVSLSRPTDALTIIWDSRVYNREQPVVARILDYYRQNVLKHFPDEATKLERLDEKYILDFVQDQEYEPEALVAAVAEDLGVQTQAKVKEQLIALGYLSEEMFASKEEVEDELDLTTGGYEVLLVKHSQKYVDLKAAEQKPELVAKAIRKLTSGSGHERTYRGVKGTFHATTVEGNKQIVVKLVTEGKKKTAIVVGYDTRSNIMEGKNIADFSAYLSHLGLGTVTKMESVPGDIKTIKFEPDAAMITDEARAVGGINLNPALLRLQIKRDETGAALPIEFQDVDNIDVDGLYPVIINITPVVNLPLMLSELDIPREEPLASERSGSMDLGYLNKPQEETHL